MSRRTTIYRAIANVRPEDATAVHESPLGLTPQPQQAPQQQPVGTFTLPDGRTFTVGEP